MKGAIELRIMTEGPRLDYSNRVFFRTHERTRSEVLGFFNQICAPSPTSGASNGRTP